MRAVFLSGPGGVGKSTIAKAAQSLLAGEWLFYESDKCLPCLPRNPGFATLRIDRRVVRATLAAVHAFVAEGFPTLVELNVADEWRRAACEERFRDVPTQFVVLTARRDLAMKRVQDRGTDPGWFDWFEVNYDGVPWSRLPNTITIDTSSASPTEVARELVQHIRAAG